MPAMTTTTDRTHTEGTGPAPDFTSTRTFAVPAAAVLAALRTPEAISSWWAPATGSGAPGDTVEVASRSGGRMLAMRVEPTEQAGRVTWSVLEADLTTEWAGTSIVFEVEDAPGGSTLRFRHDGLTPQCECFDMCQEGWGSALDRLVSFVESDEVPYARDSFQAAKTIAASPEAVLAALRSPEAITSWWTPTVGSGEDGGTLEVSFFGGDETVLMHVEPAFEHRVVWVVDAAPLTPDWVGTTIYFDVAEAGDGSMLYFRHEGLTPALECYDMCHQGWTHYLGSLVAYVEGGQLADAPDSFQSTHTLSASPATVLAALRTTEGVSGWWGPASGSADPGGTLAVSFLGGRQVIRMHVEPTSERRVVWSVEGATLTPDWTDTTIIFDVEASGDGSTVRFRHQGLTPALECFDMCHEGWTHYVASLVSFAETGQGQPSRERS
jgi:uncharacterized protein YndB with AHSA1/START domain